LPVNILKKILFELCVENLASAQAAERGGADRIELCTSLEIGGVTPAEELTAATIWALRIPVHVLIRPRGGDFVYSAAEFEQIKQQIEWVKKAGAAGVVLGVLLADGRVDVPRSRELVALAHPMKVTFHRAFDETRDKAEALEAVIETGADCLLTSGGAPDVSTGAEDLGKLVRQAGERIQIMAGGGLRLANLLEVLDRSGVPCLHGSLTERGTEREDVNGDDAAILEADVRTAIGLLRCRLRPE
jgi:copper homeostasis protein